MGEVLRRRELRDGSYWTTNITDLSSDCPPDGLLKMDLRIHQTYLSVLLLHDDDESGYEHSEIRVPTLELPGTMNRIDYYLALHKWLQSLQHLVDNPLDPGMVDDFTDQVLECVFGRVELAEKVALCVAADLHRLPLLIEDYDEYAAMVEDEEEEYEPILMEDDEEEYDPMEDYEDEEEYDPIEDNEDDGDESLIKPWVQKLLTDFHAVVAAEDHRDLGDCLICLDSLFSITVDEEEEDNEGKKKYVFASPCGHYFHGDCMSKWLSRSDSCPLCRFHISSSR